MEIIRRITPEEEYNAGLVIFRQGGVHPLEDENGFLRYAVDGDPRRIVRVGATTKLSGRCSCDFFGNVHKPCRHLAAAMMQAISTGAIEEMRRRRARENASALMGTLQSALPMETPLETRRASARHSFSACGKRPSSSNGRLMSFSVPCSGSGVME